MKLLLSKGAALILEKKIVTLVNEVHALNETPLMTILHKLSVS